MGRMLSNHWDVDAFGQVWQSIIVDMLQLQQEHLFIASGLSSHSFISK